MNLWLSDSELKGVDLENLPYAKHFVAKLSDGRSYTLLSASEKADIDSSAFIPYALIDQGMDNAMVMVDGLGEVLIYQNEYIQCLDLLKAHNIPVEQLVEVERVLLTQEQLAGLIGEQPTTEKLVSSKNRFSPAATMAILAGVVGSAIFGMFLVI